MNGSTMGVIPNVELKANDDTGPITVDFDTTLQFQSPVGGSQDTPLVTTVGIVTSAKEALVLHDLQVKLTCLQGKPPDRPKYWQRINKTCENIQCSYNNGTMCYDTSTNCS